MYEDMVLAYLRREGPKQFFEILSHLDLDYLKDGRKLDRTLQKMRKRLLVTFTKKKWSIVKD